MPRPAAAVAAERRALVRSIAATAVLSALGVAWGIAVGSQMILFDGVYGVIGIGTSWLLLQASSLAASGPSRRYPYGREGATPLVIGVQGCVLLATLLYAASEGVFTIAAGGSDLEPGLALAYGVLTAVASLATTSWLGRAAPSSDLVSAEATAWGVAAWRGVGMVGGFGLMWLLQGSRWDAAAPYVDPVMVIVTCVVFLPAPVRMVRTTIDEVLERAPSDAVQGPVHAALAAVRDEFELAEPRVRMTKLGRRLYVEVDVLVDPGVTVGDEDRVRSAVQRRLDDLPYDVWLTVELSADPGWAGA